MQRADARQVHAQSLLGSQVWALWALCNARRARPSGLRPFPRTACRTRCACAGAACRRCPARHAGGEGLARAPAATASSPWS
eukprot:4133038-Pyramimonas_sp.AAC.1